MDPLARLSPSLRAACRAAAAEAHSRRVASLYLAKEVVGPGRLQNHFWEARRWEGLRREAGIDPEPPKCGRFVADNIIVNEAEGLRLRSILSFSTSLVPSTGGDASLAPPLLAGVGSVAGGLGCIAEQLEDWGDPLTDGAALTTEVVGDFRLPWQLPLEFR